MVTWPITAKGLFLQDTSMKVTRANFNCLDGAIQNCFVVYVCRHNSRRVESLMRNLQGNDEETKSFFFLSEWLEKQTTQQNLPMFLSRC